MGIYNLLIAIIATIFAGWNLYYQREAVRLMKISTMSARQRAVLGTPKPWWRNSQVGIVALLAALTWVPWVYGLSPFSIIEYPAVETAHFGDLSDGDLYVLPTLKETKSDKKIIAAVLLYPGVVDIMDTQGLQKSEAYDFTKGQKICLISPDQSFRNARRNGVRNENFFLLEVPAAVTKDQFSTLRQAIGLGAKIIYQGSKT